MTQEMNRPIPQAHVPPHTILASSPHPGGRDLATILVVDDNRASLELARIMLLQRAGLRCHLKSAASGDEAIAIIRAQAQCGAQVDLMLLDVNMPRLDGFEVLQHLSRVDIPKPAVVMCSTSTSDQDVERAYALGASGYVEKPPRLEALRRVLAGAEGVTLAEDEAGPLLLRAA